MNIPVLFVEKYFIRMAIETGNTVLINATSKADLGADHDFFERRI